MAGKINFLNMMFAAMTDRLKQMGLCLFLAIFSKVTYGKPNNNPLRSNVAVDSAAAAYCLSWRMAVETNNVRAWRTVPTQCMHYIASYMDGGQYQRDLELIVDQILGYAGEIEVSPDGLDAWILDVDDTCLSNVLYYKRKRYGCDPYDSSSFTAWALSGGCPAIPAVLRLFNVLVDGGFRVFLVTGREEDVLGQVTTENLAKEGFIQYERLIMRSAGYKGKSAVVYKSEIRKQIEGEGYRIWGNVGDQWSDLQGECSGNRTFKLPNPMYFVP